MDGSYWRDLYRPVYAGKRWIVAADAVAGARRLVEDMHELGGGPFLIVAATLGTGELPDTDVADWILLGTGGNTFMESFREFDAALRDLPAGVVGRIDAWDPDRAAQVIHGFMPAGEPIAGRRLYGARRPEWAALEDKIAVEALWDAAGVPRAPSAVVPARRDELTAAAARLDAGLGTVWVADNREGWHGGAEYVRWVRSPADADAAASFLAGCADVVRVMPFLDGVPCSIHAMVFPEGIAVFRPVEMVVLSRADSPHFEYSGGSTFWDPPAGAASEMRGMVRSVAEHLRDTAGYRGAFGIDGVLTDAGYFPTELNPRYTGGLSIQASEVEGLAMGLLNRVVVAGEPAEYRPAALEETVLAASAARRGGWMLMKVPGTALDETRNQAVDFVGGEARPAADPDQADATLSLGPAAFGSLVMCFLEAGAVAPGTLVAPVAGSLFRLAAELWDEVEAADLAPVTARIPPGT